jgi:hypothetical protein
VLNKLLVSSLSIFLLFFHSCADDPSSVGLDLLEQDYLKIDTVNSADANYTQTSSYFKKVVSLGNSARLLIGKKENYTAHSLMNFAFILPDSIKTDFNDGNLIIESAEIEMFPNYVFTSNDSLAAFDFSVFEILSNWSSSGFTADSFTTLQFNSNDLISDKSFSDSIYSFKINNDVARKWIAFAIKPDSLTNYGILISPTLGTEKILGFQAFDPFSDTATKLKVIVSKQGSYVDTLQGFIASDISVLLGDLPSSEPDYMLVQSSLAINSKLFFDLSALPRNIVINRATLVLQSDSSKNLFGSAFENSLVALLITNSQTNEVNNELFIRLTHENFKYSGDITPMIRKWLRDDDNYGMIIRSGSEQVGAELFYLYSSLASDLTKRPYLEIVYSYN